MRSAESRVASPESRFAGFSLIELLVALAVFATMAALAYGGLDSVVRTRVELGRQQGEFQGLMRSVALLERDLRQAAARPVRGNYGEALPALVGAPERLELTRLGFANPQAELRSNLERVFYALDDATLVRGAYAVLDRAPGTAPVLSALRDHVDEFRLRYLDAGQRWSDVWPPLQSTSEQTGTPAAPLPRAIEFRITTKDCGEITRVVELVSAWPEQAVDAAAGPGPAP
jgi:general secretion pathway protein J